MPLTAEGKTVLHAMESRYGTEKGRSVFYASINKGTITGAEKRRPDWRKAKQGGGKK